MVLGIMRAKKFGSIAIKIAGGIFFFILIPLFINFLYTIQAPLKIMETEWGAAEALSFYSVVLGAGIAACGVYLTIRDSRKSYEEDIRNRVLPFFSITPYWRTHSLNMLYVALSGYDMPNDADVSEANRREAENVRAIIANPDLLYKELDEFHFVFARGKFLNKAFLTDEQKRLVSLGYIKAPKEKEHTGAMETSSQSPDVVFTKIAFDNVGNGAAVNFRVGLNWKKESSPQFTLPTTIPKDKRVFIDVFSSTNSDEDLGEFELTIDYRDIYGDKHNYRQKHTLRIERDEGGGKGIFVDTKGSGQQRL